MYQYLQLSWSGYDVF